MFRRRQFMNIWFWVGSYCEYVVFDYRTGWMVFLDMSFMCWSCMLLIAVVPSYWSYFCVEIVFTYRENFYRIVSYHIVSGRMGSYVVLWTPDNLCGKFNDDRFSTSWNRRKQINFHINSIHKDEVVVFRYYWYV